MSTHQHETREQAPCGCDDFTRSSRRSFLTGAGALLGAGAVSQVFGGVFAQAAFGAGGGGNVLVVLSLRGGADGLSLVVPHGDPGYAAVRPTIGIPGERLVAADATFGLHPGFAPLLPMWEAGSFGAVQAVGMRTPNRSHFAAMEAVEDADVGSSARVGWLNRMVGLVTPDSPMQAVQLGTNVPPTSLFGPSPVVAAGSLGSLSLPGGTDTASQQRARASISAMWSGSSSPLRQATMRTLDTTRRTRGLALGESSGPDGSPPPPRNGATYPAGGLGSALAATARLLRADVGTQVVTLDHGSWDTHADQGGLGGGEMVRLVGELAGSLAAFFTDLGALGDKVTVVTLSEFGRQVAENGSSGTDHGYGNAVLLLGAGVRGGTVHGRWPGLGGGRLTDGDLAVTTDYRDVLGDVVDARFPGARLGAVFPGLKRSPVGVMRA